MFFDTELLDLIVGYSLKYAKDNNRHDFDFDYSLKYAKDNNRHDFDFDRIDLLKFIGILCLSGYHSLPQTQLMVFTFNLSVDEQMVPYFGRHSCKMYIKGKPVRFGFKLWCLCSSDGYLYKFVPYAGASADKTTVGLGGGVVLDLLSILENPQNHQVFFDNFFSSYKLFSVLCEQGFYASGTIRDNRTSNCPLESVKSIAKKERGTHDCAYDQRTGISMVRWNDNSVVTIISNQFNSEPLCPTKRYNRKEKKYVSIDQPHVIKLYNKYMGGVDLHDNGISNNRITITGKKWWWTL
ncbi:Transposase IS4 [Popillia japonica]|uniref:Transposase IS4 n=1 Tax=Popillia japonica TaxID=7064 RepID=A0AAW1K0W4_POPJA